MPIYEYRCGACRKTFERIILGAEVEAAPPCPRCGAHGTERLVSRFSTAAKSGSDEFGDFGGDFGGAGRGGVDFGEEPPGDEPGAIDGHDEDDYGGPEEDYGGAPGSENGEDDD